MLTLSNAMSFFNLISMKITIVAIRCKWTKECLCSRLHSFHFSIWFIFWIPSVFYSMVILEKYCTFWGWALYWHMRPCSKAMVSWGYMVFFQLLKCMYVPLLPHAMNFYRCCCLCNKIQRASNTFKNHTKLRRVGNDVNKNKQSMFRVFFLFW